MRIARLRKIRSIAIVVATAIIMLTELLVVARANAIEKAKAFALSPMSQKVVLIPGEAYEGSIQVINPYDAESVFSYMATVGSYGVKGGENSVDDYVSTTEGDMTNYNQITSWIKLKNDKGTLAPNETATISFTINVPENAPGGGQYATILVQEDPQATDESNSGSNGSDIKEIMRMGSIIYAEIAGDIIEEGEILDDNIPTFLLSGNLEATSMVKNNGNVHTDAEYILQVWPMFSGEEICTNEENPSKSLVLPETKRYHAESCDLTVPGIYRVKQIVRIFGEESVVEKTIIYCPIWLIFIILFVVFALVFYFVVKAKARKKAAKRPQNA